ncbi:uncharacterized protein FRV6_14208 [Fusarium oxysporum]|uniref:Uncharacterized protein n=1 Tax=Fusarium oxysporum TaxID=5507 RepID=A0A2H3TZ86_FUSOX|nr:uncharacterized protein FRV6_14208 [Fusarium oxysporum]
MGTRTTDPWILSCAGTRPFCATVIWPQESKTSYMCAEQPSTLTVDQTTEASTAPSEPTSTEPTGFPKPEAGAPFQGTAVAAQNDEGRRMLLRTVELQSMGCLKVGQK